MMDTFLKMKQICDQQGVTLVAVSKLKPASAILALYEAGQRDFGENYPQEAVLKAAELPKDIRWHIIGKLQRNKVKSIMPFVHCIHSVDSMALAIEINKQALAINRKVSVLLQVHIAQEESKTGFETKELLNWLAQEEWKGLTHLQFRGLMGMASFSPDSNLVNKEFEGLRHLHSQLQQSFFKNFDAFDQLSMGMSGDYELALKQGTTILRIGSLLFGQRV